MTKNWDIFPKAEPSGEALANYSAYEIYNKFAVAGYGVLTGCVVSRNSGSRIDIALGTYTNNGAPRNLTATYIDSIPAASASNHRYDLIYIDGADDTVKRCAGTEGIPASSDDFLENYGVRPAEPTDTDWVPLAIIRVTENGIENLNFGTNNYATGSVVNIKMSPSFVVDDISLQVIGGVMSIKSSATTKLDDLAEPDNNEDLNTNSSRHGLCPILSNTVTHFFNGQGAFTTPDHTTLGSIGTNAHSVIDTFITSKAAASGLASLNSSSKVIQDPANATVTPTINKIPIADVAGGKLATGWIPDISATYAVAAKGVTNGDSHDHAGGDGAVLSVAVWGPYRITHNGGAAQAIVTTPALCEIDEIVVKCQEGSTTATVLIGWAANTDALMTDAEVPKILNLSKFIRYPTDEIASATALIATVGGADSVGEWDIWLKISRYT